MIVCRYFSDSYVVKTLQNLSFKVTNPNELNDPFENSPYFRKPEEQEWECYLRQNSTIEEIYNLVFPRISGHITDLEMMTREEFRERWEAGGRQQAQRDFMQVDNMETLDREKEKFSKKIRSYASPTQRPSNHMEIF